MNKLITYILINLIFSASFSQSLSVETEKGLVLSESEVVVSGLPNDPDHPDIVYAFLVKNVSASDVVVNAKRIELSVDCNTTHALCWDVCPPTTASCTSDIEINSQTRDIAAGASDDTGIGHLYPKGSSGVSKFRYVFYLESNDQDSTYIDITYKHDLVSVEDAAKEFNFSPNPTTGVINFNFSDSKAYNVSVLDLLGKAIRKDFITSGQSIDLSDEEKGVYFVIVSDNKGRKLSTQKLILE